MSSFTGPKPLDTKWDKTRVREEGEGGGVSFYYLILVCHHVPQSLIINNSKKDVCLKLTAVSTTVHSFCTVVVVTGWKIKTCVEINKIKRCWPWHTATRTFYSMFSVFQQVGWKNGLSFSRGLNNWFVWVVKWLCMWCTIHFDTYLNRPILIFEFYLFLTELVLTLEDKLNSSCLLLDGRVRYKFIKNSWSTKQKLQIHVNRAIAATARWLQTGELNEQ